jgi:hypothetical protein
MIFPEYPFRNIPAKNGFSRPDTNILTLWEDLSMKSPQDEPFGYPKSSRLISEMRVKRRQATAALDPGKKMMLAFLLSVRARKFLIEGLKAQGFSEAEIRETIRRRRR